MLIAQLLLADLVEGHAIDTERGGGTCLEPADANLDAAALALAVFAGIEPREGLVDFLDELALAVACAEFQCEIGFLRGAVVGVGEVRGLVLHVMHGAVDFLHQLALPGVQDGAKVLDLLFIHVLLALLDGIGLEVLEGGEQRLRAGARGCGGLFGVTTGMVGLLVLLLVWLVVVGLATLVFAIPVLLTLDLLPAEVLDTTFLAVAFAGTAFFTPLAGVGLALAFLVAGIGTLLPE